jgi:hypothetical protein
MIAEITNFLFSLAAGLFILAVGVVWSRGAWSHGTYGFDLGYLVVAVLVSRILCAKTGGGVFGRKEWFLMLLPAGPCWLFEALADHSLSNLKHAPTNPQMEGFVLFSCLLLVSVLVWVAVFPQGDVSGSRSKNDKLAWRRINFSTGALLGISLLLSTGWLLFRTRTSAVDFLQGLHTMESWLYKWSLLAYLFLTLRIVFPIWEGKFDAAFRRVD